MAAKKITKLTTEQEVQLNESLRYWLAVGRSTAAIDHEKASDAISAMYQAIGKPRPTVLFFSSPAMCVLAWGALRTMAQDNSSLWSQLRSQLESQLRSQLRSQLESQLGSQLSNYWAGNLWCAWEVFYDFCNKIGVEYSNEQKALLQLWLTQSQHCHWWFPYDGIVLASERPTILNIDEQGRLHSLTQVAIAYSDGWGIHAAHGVRVPEYIIERPAEISVSRIDSEQNAEIRRVMVQRYGQARYIQDSGAQCVHSLPGNYFIRGLQGARLFRKERPGDTDLVMIAVKNSTPEPDGSIKDYFLRVEPGAYGGLASRDCQAAMASTWRNEDGSLFFKRPADYRPMVES